MKKRPLCGFCSLFVLVLGLCLSLFSNGETQGEKYARMLGIGSVCQMEGIVTEKQILSGTYGDSLVLGLQTSSFGKVRCLKTLTKGENLPPMGAGILVEGEVESFSRARNTGTFDAALYYQARGYSFQLKKVQVIRQETEGSLWRENLFQLREALFVTLDRTFGNEDASILRAMLLGDKTQIDESIRYLYQQNSIIHILAISGLHISILGMGLFQFLRKCSIPLSISAGGTLIFLGLFGVMIGGGSSLKRAVFMFAIRLGAECIGRTYDMITALTVSACLLLVNSPFLLYDSGYLYSFGAITAIAVFFPLLLPASAPEKGNFSAIKTAIKMSVLSSLALSVVTLPIQLYFQYRISLTAIFLNPIVIPMMGVLMPLALVVLIGAFAGILSVPIVGWLLRLLVFGTHMLLAALEQLCRFCLQIPGHSILIGRPEGWKIAVFVGMLFGPVFVRKPFSVGFLNRLFPFEFIGRERRWCLWIWILVASVFLCCRSNPRVRVTMIDVGQGDGLCIQLSGQTWMVDGGSSSEKNLGKNILIPFLESQGIRRVDDWFVSHVDEDHISGLVEVLEKQVEGFDTPKVSRLILPALGNPDEEYRNLCRLGQAAGCKVLQMKKGDQLNFQKASIKCLHPMQGQSFNDRNDGSLVLRLETDEICGYFMGDLDGEAELRWVRDEKARAEAEARAEAGVKAEAEGKGIEKKKRMTLLKCGHHGSQNACSQELLSMLQPDVTLISCGEDNPYGHPHAETLKRLKAFGSKIYTTMDSGEIKVDRSSKGKVRLWRYKESL